VDEIVQRARDVRLLVLDVDGVLTDGRLLYSSQGEEAKTFHVRDGYGIVALLRAGIEVAVISGRSSQAVSRRMHELGIRRVLQGVAPKLPAYEALLADLGLTDAVTACVGDDTPDVPLLERARLAVAVADAHVDARTRAHYVTRAAGGRGAVREVCDLLLAVRGVPGP
jgi:3-deoxy-D-manno-octulosonate 8-phosphate phosphatase (KDO 8-P phosphatase)